MQSETKICQSCGMPMEKIEDFGTNADGSRNEDYCCFCFKNGDFTNPNLTIDQMIDKLIGFADKMGMTQAQAREMAQAAVIPKLKRWQKRN
ncbi:MAG: zinc ribbon domain-containing protein [Nitrospirota bacterium]